MCLDALRSSPPVMERLEACLEMEHETTMQLELALGRCNELRQKLAELPCPDETLTALLGRSEQTLLDALESGHRVLHWVSVLMWGTVTDGQQEQKG